MAAVATLGPVSVSIDAASMGFKYFAGAPVSLSKRLHSGFEIVHNDSSAAPHLRVAFTIFKRGPLA